MIILFEFQLLMGERTKCNDLTPLNLVTVSLMKLFEGPKSKQYHQ